MGRLLALVIAEVDAKDPERLDLLRFSGEASGQSAANLSNRFGLVKSRAEWRLTGL